MGVSWFKSTFVSTLEGRGILFDEACNHVKKVVEVLPRDKVTHWRGPGTSGERVPIPIVKC